MCVCFYAASELVDWCLSSGEVKSRVEGTKIGQVRERRRRWRERERERERES